MSAAADQAALKYSVNQKETDMGKKILITGASGGFGKLMIDALSARGHSIAASMRGVSGKNKAAAEALKQKSIPVVELDVTDDESVRRGVADATKAIGGIDVVINNAGVGVLGLQEMFTAEDWKRLFDINVFGVQRVNRAVLPEMRAKKSGLLVHVSSLLGRIAIPFYGPYNASKWALEAMAENYRVELSGFGVDVAIVEPGGYPTSFIDNLMQPSDTSLAPGYGEMAGAPESFLKGFEGALAGNPAQNPVNVADAVANLIDMEPGTRPFRTIVDKMGMGEHIQAYNDQLGAITAGIYSAFGIGGMLALKK